MNRRYPGASDMGYDTYREMRDRHMATRGQDREGANTRGSFGISPSSSWMFDGGMAQLPTTSNTGPVLEQRPTTHVTQDSGQQLPGRYSPQVPLGQRPAQAHPQNAPGPIYPQNVLPHTRTQNVLPQTRPQNVPIQTYSQNVPSQTRPQNIPAPNYPRVPANTYPHSVLYHYQPDEFSKTPLHFPLDDDTSDESREELTQHRIYFSGEQQYIPRLRSSSHYIPVYSLHRRVY